MKMILQSISVLVAAAAALHAADWESVKRTPAQVEVLNMKPQRLEESADKKGWAKVPPQLTKNNAMIYMPNGNTNGVADLKVTADGYLLVACNYDYQGNSQGKWDEEVWDERKFKTKGWHPLSKNELGGELIGGDNRAQVIFLKQVKKGDTLRLRCNKYEPPHPIVFAK